MAYARMTNRAAGYIVEESDWDILTNNMDYFKDVEMLPQGMHNAKIVTSVATSDLTVAIKTLAGSDPSAADPVVVRIGDTIRTITAALSVTALDATNWCNAGAAENATQDLDFFVYLGYNATDGVVVGFSRIAHARIYSDFSATTTSDRFCKISDITTAAGTDEYENVGRINATLSAGAGYTWTIPATSIIVNRPIFYTRKLTWVPSWDNLTEGNGTVTAFYVIRGSAVEYNLYVLFGSTTSVDGAFVNALTPIAPDSAWVSTFLPIGHAMYWDHNVSGLYAGDVHLTTGDKLAHRVNQSDGTYGLAAGLDTTIPFTWAVDDKIRTSGRYDL